MPWGGGSEENSIEENSVYAKLRSLGKFDYIIVHGIYSWVPEMVKDAIFEVGRKFLAPHGVIYISYNTYPGWKSKDVLRDLMLFATSNEVALNLSASKDIAKRQIEVNGSLDDKNRLIMAKGFTQVFVDFCEKIGEKKSYELGISRHSLEHAKKVLDGSYDDSYILHEYLETFNAPCYFKDFIARAQKHGLEYVSDTHLSSQFSKFLDFIPQNLKPKDRILKEQFGDFLSNRAFRTSILGLKEHMSGDGFASVSKKTLCSLHFKAGFKYEDEKITLLKSGEKINPSFKWICDEFNACYPGTLSLATLLEKYPSREGEIWQVFAQLLTGGMVEFSSAPLLALGYEAGKTRLKEALRGYVKYFASNENRSVGMATCLNEMVRLSVIEARLALLCDGRDESALVKGLKEIIQKSGQKISYTKNGKVIKASNPSDEMALNILKSVLNRLANAGYFELIN